jgi:hypothetical protein
VRQLVVGHLPRRGAAVNVLRPVIGKILLHLLLELVQHPPPRNTRQLILQLRDLHLKLLRELRVLRLVGREVAPRDVEGRQRVLDAAGELGL